MVRNDLNRLQRLREAEQYFVTLNPDGPIDEHRASCAGSSTVTRLCTRAAIGAQRQWGEVSGVNRTHFCGAYWFYGFHEDGLNSAVRVAQAFGVKWSLVPDCSSVRCAIDRFAPVSHAFTYPLFMALLDIDRVPQLMRASRVTSYNRWNWASFDKRDHFGTSLAPPSGFGSHSTRSAMGSTFRTGQSSC